MKISTWAHNFQQAAAKMDRNLQEFRIRGCKNKYSIFRNVVKHEKFISGNYDTCFIDTTPELFVFPIRKDRGTKMIKLHWECNVKRVPWN